VKPLEPVTKTAQWSLTLLSARVKPRRAVPKIIRVEEIEVFVDLNIYKILINITIESTLLIIN
jgi:hypothetical protein